jgi:hypothetical protein
MPINSNFNMPLSDSFKPLDSPTPVKDAINSFVGAALFTPGILTVSSTALFTLSTLIYKVSEYALAKLGIETVLGVSVSFISAASSVFMLSSFLIIGVTGLCIGTLVIIGLLTETPHSRGFSTHRYEKEKSEFNVTTGCQREKGSQEQYASSALVTNAKFRYSGFGLCDVSDDFPVDESGREEPRREEPRDYSTFPWGAGAGGVQER